MITIAHLLSYLQQIIPLSMAASWDNVGLLLGDEASPVERVMTCLTLTPESAAEAVAGKVQLIVTHHPILFRGAKRLTTATPEGGMLWDLARAGIAVYSPHTAFDDAPGGINDLLAAKLGLIDVKPLREGEGLKPCKVVVFVPDQDLLKVSDAMFAAGAGHIGQYRECSFRMAGMGTFFGSETSNPTLGQKGRREEVSEWRLEVLCPEGSVDQVVKALRQAHSYEEPAFEVYPLKPQRSQSGQGRIGALPQPTSLLHLAQQLKESLQCNWMQMVGDGAGLVRRVALACGAAGEFVTDAIQAKADLFLTGEIRFHDALAARAQHLALLIPGHFASERHGLEVLAQRLATQFPQLQIWASRSESEPFILV